MGRKTLCFFSFSVLFISSLIASAPGPLAALPWGSPTTISISSSANPSAAGKSFTLTATVTSEVAEGPAITGKVLFKEENKTIGAILMLENGSASLDISNLEVGEHRIIARYSGDANYAPSNSGEFTQSVVQPALTFFGSPQQPLSSKNGTLLAYVTITNTGSLKVDSLQVTSATLGSGSLQSAPAPISNLEPGQGAVVTLTFATSAVSSTATNAPLKLHFEYSVKSPPLTGKSTLSFPGVTLR